MFFPFEKKKNMSDEQNIEELIKYVVNDTDDTSCECYKLKTILKFTKSDCEVTVATIIEYTPSLTKKKRLDFDRWIGLQKSVLNDNKDYILNSCVILYKHMKKVLSDSISISMQLSFSQNEGDSMDDITLKIGKLKRLKRKRKRIES